MANMECKVVLLLLGMIAFLAGVEAQSKSRKTPATFVLGDSLVDVGNNDYIFTIATADHKPYGVDWTGEKATGRFCNGKIIPDLVNDYLGTPYPLPVLAPEATGSNLLHGVNYASAGSGILEETGTIFIGRMTLAQQYTHFQDTKKQIADLIGQKGADELINNAIYSITTGGNDWVNNYYALTTTTKQRYTTKEFGDLLITTYRDELKTAYSLGMRKFIISSMGPIGCAPSIVSSKSVAGECVQEMNNLALIFNSALKPMLRTLQDQLPNSVFLYANAYDVVKEVVDNPLRYGFTEPATTACCGLGKYNGLDGSCRTVSNLCPDRTKSVFWDAFHPTESVNRICNEKFLNGGLESISPMNVKQLLAMK